MTRSDRTSQISVLRDGYSLSAERIAPPAPGRPWLVFSNSLVTDVTIWDAQVDRFADRFGILRYDQMGHGTSGLSPRTPDFDALGSDLLCVMDAASVDRAIYVGLSMGVPTGLAAHAAQANRFAGLVFSDGQCRTAPGGGAAWEERIANAESSGMDAFARATANRWLTAATSDDRRARLIDMIAATPFEGFRACATALMQYDYADELARIAVPTLLIAGAEDGAMPDGMASNLKPNIAGAELTVIPDAGHVPCFEQPEAFNRALDGFLPRLDATAAPIPQPLNVK
ncbi:3-oxoadipate enol-lactonase [Primorskyibacter sedentarius]|uniref:3-oxoadipate enol-lactonase n=1 Tax=Primorskyibacter sedentarius TaxID=745311 RepID=A0A4R3JFC4_9RHOB|nr:alpha/beta fold hydrolase [Primorskyibacter sedentarius]TCS64622.1 3-oxoadipate enol-lactonase [Primorskyibacter sedentarius]